jgi:nicotinamidase-related amidase
MSAVGGDGRFPEHDVEHAREIYSRSGIGSRVGVGDRPAVLVVDLQYGFTDPSAPLGGNLDDVIAATDALLTVARRNSFPVAFTAVAFHETQLESTTWLRKMPGLRSLISGTRECEIDARVAPVTDEPVFEKQAASAFFGTSLVSYLVGAGVDTVVVAGCVTSGCVRASVVDAISWGFRTIVPEECVGDRAPGPHAWNLFDMDSKYGDVEPLEDVITALESTLTAMP